MKKQTNDNKRKRLSLKKSLVRNLDLDQLREVVGGDDLNPAVTGFAC